MDGHRFDALTKALAESASRRRLLRTMGGTVAGGFLAVVGLKRASAATPYGGHCSTNDQCGTGYCQIAANGNNRCLCPPGGSYCTANGRCCASGFRCVSGTCQLNKAFTLPHSPVVVWQALTDPVALGRWGMANDVEPRIGHRFQLRAAPRAGFDGVMEGEVIALDPPRRMVFTWRGGPLAQPATVTLTLDPVAGGTQTHLSLTHEGGDAACKAAALLLGREWHRSLLGGALPDYLNATRA